MKLVKNTAILASPLLLFIVLFKPYCWIDQKFIVEWLGCGCPAIDEFGNVVENNFNANDFTALFWLFVSVCATVISVFLSARIPKDKKWLKAVYIIGMFLASLLISYIIYQLLMWN